MNSSVLLRIVRDCYCSSGFKATYWKVSALARELGRLSRPENHQFRSHVIDDQLRFIGRRVRPIEGETFERAQAAVAWLLRAQSATPDDGVSLGYFPCSADPRPWRAAYPETTGYIITSLLTFWNSYGDQRVRDVAFRMARWEADIQMASGAVQGGPVCPAEKQTPAAFNTGMVLDGWCSAYAINQDPVILAAARRAADFLVDDLDSDGYFRTNGAFVSAGEIKTYTCLCSWAILRFGEISSEQRYQSAALLIIEAALRQQQPNGWFAHNCLARSDAPLTHTIGYTLQGILEVGALTGRLDFIAAVRRTVDQIASRVTKGYLPATFYADWKPAQLSSCLTGSAQIAVVCYRLFELTNIDQYRQTADRLVNYLKALQKIDSSLSDINGALAGSFPLFGQYMRGGYPNWATKYLLDALMLQDRLSRPGGASRTSDVETFASKKA